MAIHVGRPVDLECEHGGESHSNLAIHGDIDIIPPGIPACWEMNEKDTTLLLAVSPKLLNQVAKASGFETDGVEARIRFQVRDPHIEHIGWALKAEVEQNYPGGKPYMESMAIALGAQLLSCHSSLARDRRLPDGGLSPRKLGKCFVY